MAGAPLSVTLEMHKSSMLALLSVAAILGVIALPLILASIPKSAPIGLGLQSYTNTWAAVGITNRSSHQFNYIVMVERKFGSNWPKGLSPGITTQTQQSGILGPGQFTNLTLPVMVYAPPYPWRISVFCNRRAAFQQNSLRFKAGILALSLRMRKLAQVLLGGSSFKQIQVSTTEMQQWEK